MNPFELYHDEHLESRQHKHEKRQELLMNSFRDIQVFLMPDPKLKTLDHKPQFEVSFAQAIEQKPRQVSTSEMEEKIVHMPSIGFHQNVNR